MRGLRNTGGGAGPQVKGEASFSVKFGQVLKAMRKRAKRLAIWGRASRQRI